MTSLLITKHGNNRKYTSPGCGGTVVREEWTVSGMPQETARWVLRPCLSMHALHRMASSGPPPSRATRAPCL